MALRLPLLLWLVGCADLPVDAEDTACADCPPPLRLQHIEWECDEEWWYSVGTNGWTASIELAIAALGEWDGSTAPYREDHVLVEVEWAEDQSWTRWELTLASSTRADAESSVSTALVCEVDGPENHGFRLWAYGAEGLADCGIWGQRSAQFFDNSPSPACYCFDQARGCGIW
ncbi:MAG: hypothetical protein EP330_02885 [Deltaproteobacteria bacterium]|nr:MAG: hypothetical protein EP330_02885 [Deltaproteobacteria bacterium]